MRALTRLRHAIVSIFDRYPLNSPWVHSTLRAGFARWFLPCWFAYHSTVSLLYMSHWPNSFAFDVRLYRLAAEAWLAGQDPWAPTLGFDHWHPAISYAGPPPTLLPFIVLTWIPVDVLVLAFVLISGAVAMWTLRRIGLPIWWMLFPPLVEGIWVGNLNIFVIALLVAGGSVAGGLAAILKVYAAVPLVLLGRWKPLVIAGLVMLVTYPFLPWAEFLAQYPRISASLTDQAWGGVTNMYTTPLVLAGAAIGLVLIGRQQAAWLAVPVLWPATQFHYSVMALPALSPFLAAFAAVNQPGFLGLGVILYALWLRRDLVTGVFARRPSTEIRSVRARQELTGG